MAELDLDKIYAQHAAEVYRFLLKLCGEHSLAEDLLQDTFLKAIEKIDTFDERCKLTSWLCSIAKNTYLDHVRKTSRRPHSYLDDESAEPSAPSFEDRLMTDETAREIRRAVHQLTEPYKEVFMLRVYAELSFKEIALTFGKTEVWGRVTFLRSKDMVLKSLEKNER
ncbi:MAG: RNA polymerase sigma factor [Oscillospiraceae bacterium]|nr:RNA polymerase sigma factor [Oscillospiraceae bacterium]